MNHCLWMFSGQSGFRMVALIAEDLWFLYLWALKQVPMNIRVIRHNVPERRKSQKCQIHQRYRQRHHILAVRNTEMEDDGGIMKVLDESSGSYWKMVRTWRKNDDKRPANSKRTYQCQYVTTQYFSMLVIIYLQLYNRIQFYYNYITYNKYDDKLWQCRTILRKQNMWSIHVCDGASSRRWRVSRSSFDAMLRLHPPGIWAGEAMPFLPVVAHTWHIKSMNISVDDIAYIRIYIYTDAYEHSTASVHIYIQFFLNQHHCINKIQQHRLTCSEVQTWPSWDFCGCA